MRLTIKEKNRVNEIIRIRDEISAARQQIHIEIRQAEVTVLENRLTREQVCAMLNNRMLMGYRWITAVSVNNFNRHFENSTHGNYSCYSVDHQPPLGWHWGWVEGVRGVVLRSDFDCDYITGKDVANWSQKKNHGDKQ